MRQTDLIPDMTFIDSHKNDAAALYESLRNLRPLTEALYLIFEYSANGVYLIDGDGTMRYFNKAYERLTGFNREDMIGKNCHTVHQDMHVDYSVASISIIEHREVTQDLFFPLTKKLITISTKLILNDDDSIYAVIGNLVDVTDIIQSKSSYHTGDPLLSTQGFEQFISDFQKNPSLITKDRQMEQVLYYAKKAAISNANIFITGETGVGKEVMAKFIHENSQYKDGPFIQVNCGAIPDNLIESELFGYTSGAFTGADKGGKAGLFEAADHGTIFLDEIGELPFQVQASLLRVLQERTVRRIGSLKKVHIDVRIISATNQDLKKYVEEKKFREDLYYRINVVPIDIPPLRERTDDIIPLSLHFLNTINKHNNSSWYSLTADSIEILKRYRWPGNIRELRNVLERAAALCDGNVITPNLLFDNKVLKGIEISHAAISPDTVAAESPVVVHLLNALASQKSDWECDLQKELCRYEAEMLNKYYEHYGTIRAAAKALHMDRSTFQRKLAMYKEKSYI